MIRLAKEALNGIEDGNLEDKYRWEQGFTLQAYTLPDSAETRELVRRKTRRRSSERAIHGPDLYPEPARPSAPKYATWLAANVPREPLPASTPREGFEQHRAWEAKLFESRWRMVTWPTELGGRGCDLIEWLIFEEEYYGAGAPMRVNQNGSLSCSGRR